jgi:uncharacterized membrane protein
MRIPTLLATAALLLGGCGGRDEPQANSGAAQPAAAQAMREAGWDLHSSGAGVTLELRTAAGAAAIRLLCPAGGKRLLVNVPAFKAIGSEERLSFGSGGAVVALVADSGGDTQRGGVTATGPIPATLATLVSGPVSASYGARSSGPHPAPPANLARAFVAACSGDAARPVPPPPPPIGACLTQDGKPVPANRIRAIGTEPFWGARVEGRCVTYSHPEDQRGTRVWTRFGGTTTEGSWTGALNGAPFVLRTRAHAGCSDGMSDNRYPIAVTLTVGGEQRTGCAEPLSEEGSRRP